MRLALVLVLLLAVAAPAAAQDGLRVNDLQARGTHNSFHRDPGFPGSDVPGWGYSHAPIDHQFQRGGVRQIELDVHYNAARDEFEVYHAWFGDDRTTCDPLAHCLSLIRAFSEAHPGHHPILVLVEFKDNGPPKNTELPEDGDPFTEPFTAATYDKLDAALADGLGAERLLTPDDVTVPGLDLRTSITTRGWPLLKQARGTVLTAVDGDDHAAAYSRGWTSLAGRSLFVQAEGDKPVAAFVSRDGARLPGEDKYARMRRLVGEGFLVRDYSGPGSFEAAKAAGAHFISSDEPEQLVLSDDPLAPSRCNPVTAPAVCADREIETHDPSDWEPVSPEPDDSTAAVAREKVERLGCGTARSALALLAGIDPGCPTRMATSGRCRAQKRSRKPSRRSTRRCRATTPTRSTRSSRTILPSR